MVTLHVHVASTRKLRTTAVLEPHGGLEGQALIHSAAQRLLPEMPIASIMTVVTISMTDHTDGRGDQTMHSSNYFEINYGNPKIKMAVPNKLKLLLTGYLDPGMFSVLQNEQTKGEMPS